jgi:hypothetical protein
LRALAVASTAIAVTLASVKTDRRVGDAGLAAAKRPPMTPPTPKTDNINP